MVNLNFIRYCCLKPFKSWKNKYLKYITKKEGQKSAIYNETLKEISEYTKEPPEIVKQKHKIGPEGEKNMQYLCSITLPYLRRNKYRRVMDFGAGAGELCIELAKNKLDVTYCDIGEQLYNFAQWRFKERNLTIRMIKGIENTRELFDCIFSFDTFEHIKDLPSLLKTLVGYIKEGGGLIFSGAFSGGTLHLEENEKYNKFKNLDILMQTCGLVFQDKFAQFYFYKKPKTLKRKKMAYAANPRNQV